MPDAVAFNRSTNSDAAPKSDASTEELLAFERMLADLSARFANIPAEKVQFEIQVAQAMLRQFLGFDRSTFAEFQDDGSLVVLSSTAVEGVDPTPLGPLPPQLSWFVDKLRSGEIFAVQTPADDLPPEAVGEAEYFRRTGMHSHLSIPLRIGGTRYRRDRLCGLPRNPQLAGRSDRAAEAGRRRVRACHRAPARAGKASMRAGRNQGPEGPPRARECLSQGCRAGPAAARALGKSPRFLSVLDEIAQVAQTGSTVLLLGETGTRQGGAGAGDP